MKLLHEQIQDRLRHYEAQAQLVETLQKELHSSQVQNIFYAYYNIFIFVRTKVEDMRYLSSLSKGSDSAGIIFASSVGGQLLLRNNLLI